MPHLLLFVGMPHILAGERFGVPSGNRKAGKRMRATLNLIMTVFQMHRIPRTQQIPDRLADGRPFCYRVRASHRVEIVIKIDRKPHKCTMV